MGTAFAANVHSALPFPATERLRFMAVLQGVCWLLAGMGAPQLLSSGIMQDCEAALLSG